MYQAFIFLGRPQDIEMTGRARGRGRGRSRGAGAGDARRPGEAPKSVGGEQQPQVGRGRGRATATAATPVPQQEMQSRSGAAEVTLKCAYLRTRMLRVSIECVVYTLYSLQCSKWQR